MRPSSVSLWSTMTSSSIGAVWVSNRSTTPVSSRARFLVGMMAATVSRVTSTSGGTIQLARLGDGPGSAAQHDHAEGERKQHHQVDDLAPDDVVDARGRRRPVMMSDPARAGDANEIGGERHHHGQRDDPETAERADPRAPRNGGADDDHREEKPE